MAARRLLCLFACVTGARATCEAWCNNPCNHLNGNTNAECGTCEEPIICRPGAEGFGELPAPKEASGQSTNPDSSHYDTCDWNRTPELCAEAKAAVEAGDISSHGNPIRRPTAFVEDWTVGSCDLQKVHHSKVTREMVLDAKEPFVVVGLTETWDARSNWAKDELLKAHGDAPYHLHASGNQSLGKLLEWEGKYHMGHAVYPPAGCYADPWRPYSPMLFHHLVDDYSVPEYFTPMSTFQMGIGTGYGIGVPPENHPSSWFAAIKGRKRWVLNAPEVATGRSGGPGSEPPEVMQRIREGGQLCEPANKPKWDEKTTALHCDQQEGEVMWVPDWWWHETCGLDHYSIGIGGITYRGCCADREYDGVAPCVGYEGQEGEFYRISEIEGCTAGELNCGTLPITNFA